MLSDVHYDTIAAMNQEIRENIYLLNRGGCGSYAYRVAHHLSKIDPSVGIVIEGGWYLDDMISNKPLLTIQDIESIMVEEGPHLMNSMEAWEQNGLSFHHLLVGVTMFDEEYVIDSTQIVTREDFEEYQVVYEGMFNHEYLKYMVRQNSQGWNPLFQRDQIPLLNKIIDKHMRRLTRKCIQMELKKAA